MTATCEKCEQKLSDDEIQDAHQIYAENPAIDCVGCVMVNMRFDEVLQ